jgi:D-methionine transport system ATP-binding protein
MLLLDEPTSNLDIGTAHRLLQVLSQLVQTQYTTILMVNHQLDMASSCNNVIFLSQGRLISNQLASDVNWGKLKDDITQSAIDDF